MDAVEKVDISDESVSIKEKENKPSEQCQEEFFNGLHILVAEDNEMNMEILCELLKMRCVEVTKAWNGREAVEQFTNHDVGYFDCIFMDMHMPIMDGCEAAKIIRELECADGKQYLFLL